jgi:hypothetical protein
LISSVPILINPTDVISPSLVLIILFIIYLLQKKSKPITAYDIALRLGLKYERGHSAQLIAQFACLNRMHYGEKKHIRGTFTGRYRKHQVVVFDMRYETCSLQPQPPDVYTFYILMLPKQFPETTIYHEGLISKIKQFTGAGDIAFESHEFSRKFCVRSASPRFAYDFCNSRMIEFLLQNTDLSVEVDEDALCISFNEPIKYENMKKELNRLVAIRDLMPEYLFED